MKTYLFGIALLALLVAGCATQQQATGAQAAPTFSTLHWTNSSGSQFSFNGANNQNLSNGVYTDSLDVSRSTDFALWVSCVGNVSVARYQTSPDGNLWFNGSVAMAPCVNNQTRYEPSEKAFSYIRGYVQTGLNSGAGNVTNITFLLSAK